MIFAVKKWFLKLALLIPVAAIMGYLVVVAVLPSKEISVQPVQWLLLVVILPLVS